MKKKKQKRKPRLNNNLKELADNLSISEEIRKFESKVNEILHQCPRNGITYLFFLEFWKKNFAPEGYDGMTIDSRGNVYITMQNSVEVYSPSGNKIESIKVPDKPTNVCFGGKDKRTLFVTARVSLYSIRMNVKGIQTNEVLK